MSDPTPAQRSKPNRAIKIIAGGVICLVLISAAALISRNLLLDQGSPAASPDPSPSGPLPGSLMAWVDGSTLMFVPGQGGPDNNGKEGLWITLDPVSNYQFSLCVQGRKCTPPTDPESAGAYDDPTMEDWPVAAEWQEPGYCDWILGQLRLVPQTIKSMLSDLDKKIKSLKDEAEKLKQELKLANQGLEDLSKHQQSLPAFVRILNSQGPGSYAYLSAQYKENIAELQALLDEKLAEIEGAKKAAQELEDLLESMEAAQAAGSPLPLHCIVRAPLPMPVFSRTNAYLDPADSDACAPVGVSNSQQFCQDGIGYQTLDLIPGKAPAGAGFQLSNFTGGEGGARCDQVADAQDRILCTSGGGTNLPGGFIDVGRNCEGLTGVLCQAGWTLDGAGCVNNLDADPARGIDGWTLSPHGVLVPVSAMPLPNGALVGPALQNTSVFHGMMITHETALTNPLGMGVACPAGYYRDPGASDGCVSLGEPLNTCLDGYEFDPAAGCVAAQPGGNYPGCRLGEVFDPVDGLCEPMSKVLSPNAVWQTTRLALDLPDCSANARGDGRGPTGGGTCMQSCPP